MDKRHTDNIWNFIERKVQKAENQVDNNCPELAAEILENIENDIRIGIQTGLLPDNYYAEAIEFIYNKIDRLNKITIEERGII